MKIKNYKQKITVRLRKVLEGLPDDEIFTTRELSEIVGVDSKVIWNKVECLPNNNFSDRGTRLWGSEKAVVAAKKEIGQSENL